MANDFSGDSSIVALWNFESGALTTDSKGTNTLTNNGTVQEDTTDYKQGSCSAYFYPANNESFTIADGDLSSDFPFKNGDTNKEIFLGIWFNVDNIYSGGCNFFYKGDYGLGKDSFQVRFNYAVDHFVMEMRIGYNGGASTETLTLDPAGYGTISYDTWYWFGCNFKDSDKSYSMRLYNASGTLIHGVSGTATNNINIEDGLLAISGIVSWGSVYTSDYGGKEMYGNLDEMVVGKTSKSNDDMAAIAAGTYSAGAGGGLSIPVAMYHYLRH